MSLRNPMKLGAVLALLMAPFPTVGMAQHAHAHSSNSQPVGQEPGQGAFAAISEIVTLLGQDDTTDWSKVDIAGLRQHLVDMADLMMKSVVDVTPLEDGIRVTINLDLPENTAAARMVPAHAPVLASETGWHSQVSRQGNDLVWDVVSAAETEQIKGLGFFGVMAIGDHHRAHHMALARGNSMH